MKNHYEIVNKTVKVFVDSPKNGRLEVLIDREDLDLVNAFEGTLTVNRSGKNHYAILAQQTGKKCWTKLHRLIINAPPGKIVHHKNHNTLDNRKENLEVKTQAEHVAEHRNGCGKGYTISKRKRKTGHKYELSRCEGGLTVYYGIFDTQKEAENYGRQFREWDINYPKCSMARES